MICGPQVGNRRDSGIDHRNDDALTSLSPLRIERQAERLAERVRHLGNPQGRPRAAQRRRPQGDGLLRRGLRVRRRLRIRAHDRVGRHRQDAGGFRQHLDVFRAHFRRQRADRRMVVRNRVAVRLERVAQREAIAGLRPDDDTLGLGAPGGHSLAQRPVDLLVIESRLPLGSRVRGNHQNRQNREQPEGRTAGRSSNHALRQSNLPAIAGGIPL